MAGVPPGERPPSTFLRWLLPLRCNAERSAWRPELAVRVCVFVFVFVLDVVVVGTTFLAVVLFWMAASSMLDMRRRAG